MKQLILLLFLSCSLLCADEIPITLEYAKTAQERTRGLMERTTLPPDHGMLFFNPKKEKMQIWMYNCTIDLSVAFLDEEGIIREIHEMKAYPEKMQQSPPDIDFFLEKSVTSSFASSFTLEMNKDWFYNHHVSIGDRVKWDENTNRAFIIRNNSKK